MARSDTSDGNAAAGDGDLDKYDVAETEAATAPADVAPAHDPDETAADPDPAASDDVTPTEVIDPEPAAVASTAPAVVEREVVKRGGFVPALLGGLIAAAIGVVGGWYATNEGWLPATGSAALDEMAADLEELRGAEADRQAALDDVVDRIGPLETASGEAATLGEAVSALAARTDEMQGTMSSLSEDMAALSDRVDEIEARPAPEAVVSEETEAAVEARMQQIEDQISDRLDTELAAIEETRARAAEAEAEAATAAQAAAVQGALSRIEASLDDGTAYAQALGELDMVADAEIPEGLSTSAESGVPTLRQLQRDFPERARAALDAAIRGQAETGTVDRVSAFLRSQLGTRSLAPREGDDPDAILSRAEAALADGDLRAALEEIAALPEDGQAALSDWRAAAQTRLDAVSAFETLRDTVSN